MLVVHNEMCMWCFESGFTRQRRFTTTKSGMLLSRVGVKELKTDRTLEWLGWCGGSIPPQTRTPCSWTSGSVERCELLLIPSTWFFSEWGREWCLSLRRWLHPNRRKNWVDTIFEGLRMKLFQTVAVVVRHRSKCFWDRIRGRYENYWLVKIV